MPALVEPVVSGVAQAPAATHELPLPVRQLTHPPPRKALQRHARQYLGHDLPRLGVGIV